MASHTVHIPEDLVQDIEKVIADGAFESTADFVASAVEQKLLDLQRDEFYGLTDGIRQGLQERGHTIRQILDEIERLRHEDHHRC